MTHDGETDHQAGGLVTDLAQLIAKVAPKAKNAVIQTVSGATVTVKDVKSTVADTEVLPTIKTAKAGETAPVVVLESGLKMALAVSPIASDNVIIDSASTSGANSSTNTSTLVTHLSKSVVLPAGTYDITVQWDVAAKHSAANGVVRVELQRDGVSVGVLQKIAQSAADSYRTLGQVLIEPGQSGTVSFDIQFRPVTAGTATVTGGRMLILGKRVA